MPIVLSIKLSRGFHTAIDKISQNNVSKPPVEGKLMTRSVMATRCGTTLHKIDSGSSSVDGLPYVFTKYCVQLRPCQESRFGLM